MLEVINQDFLQIYKWDFSVLEFEILKSKKIVFEKHSFYNL